MNPKKCILPLILLISTAFVYAQNDTVRKPDSSNLKGVLFKKDFLNNKTDFIKLPVSFGYHKFYNPELYRTANNYDLFITSWPNQDYSNMYTQYSLRNTIYNDNYRLNTYQFSKDPANPWFDPTNPSGATSPQDAIILGTLNYLWYKLLSGE